MSDAPKWSQFYEMIIGGPRLWEITAIVSRCGYRSHICNYNYLHACRSSHLRGEANLNHNLNQIQPSKNPNLKTQTVDLSALQLCPSEVLQVLEPKTQTILNQSINFDSYRYVDWR